MLTYREAVIRALTYLISLRLMKLLVLKIPIITYSTFFTLVSCCSHLTTTFPHQWLSFLLFFTHSASLIYLINFTWPPSVEKIDIYESISSVCFLCRNTTWLSVKHWKKNAFTEFQEDIQFIICSFSIYNFTRGRQTERERDFLILVSVTVCGL